MLELVEHWLDRLLAGALSEVVSALDARLCLRGERAELDDTPGIVRGVAASGGLRFEVDGQERELVSGRLRPL
jgi:hypothetical protein